MAYRVVQEALTNALEATRLLADAGVAHLVKVLVVTTFNLDKYVCEIAATSVISQETVKTYVSRITKLEQAVVYACRRGLVP